MFAGKGFWISSPLSGIELYIKVICVPPFYHGLLNNTKTILRRSSNVYKKSFFCNIFVREPFLSSKGKSLNSLEVVLWHVLTNFF